MVYSSLPPDVRREAVEIAERIYHEVNSATRSWTLVEAFIGSPNGDQISLKTDLNEIGLMGTANGIVKALTRDVLMALFRATDDPGKDRQTLCRLIAILRDVPDTSLKQASSTHNGPLQDNLDFLLSHVPPSWKNAPLRNNQLATLRSNLKPTRDRLVAHAADYSSIIPPKFHQIRALLKLVAELQAAASLVFSETHHDLQERWDLRLSEAHDFWCLVQRGAKSAK